ncbi:thiol reductant ABC exporter subunit CydD [Phyllobacterium leguminum]|uniref:ATP-binding cassette subfamily C protein CydD n=1 Tax=Phyllobacterium leguminum TaxID=314237 RepID=A0A318T666_9HYPH|nr:thiol reductant ABC exporter subunit CydD [Phyllobacterium leguminum]PYE90518.1 ATP-binding cassette subfamily C protein CydD [Phyllobacterium leguminum]
MPGRAEGGALGDSIKTATSRKSSPRAGAALQAVAALLWLPQAGLLAYALGIIMNDGAMRRIILIAAAVFGFGILRAALDAAGSRIAFKAARQTLGLMRERAVAALGSRSPLDSGRPASGMAASVIAEQAEAIIPYLARFQPVRLRVTVVPLVFLAAVLWFSWVAALVLLLAAPLIPVFMALIGWRAKAASEAQLAELGGMNGFLLDRLRGLATIRAFDAVDLTARRLRDNAEGLRKRTMAVLRIAFLSSAVLELFSALGVAMVAVYIGFHLLGSLDFGAWGDKLSLSDGFFILLLAPAFFEPLRDLSAVWHDRASGEAAMKALEALGEDGAPLIYASRSIPLAGRAGVGVVQNRAQPSPSPSARSAGTFPARGKEGAARLDEGYAPLAVELSNLRFRHAGSDNLLFDDFNLSIAPGEHIALFGPSGCGKSSLLALMAGLVTAEEGHLTIGNVPLLPDTAAELRERMAWVGQKPHVFAGSVETNVTLGRGGSKAQVQAALEVAALTDVIEARASLGENGIGLSGGEALRLAIARAAFNTQAAIILADEPTAHLDEQTAAKVNESLLTLAQGRTLIVATHDQALAARMDRIVRLDFENTGRA